MPKKGEHYKAVLKTETISCRVSSAYKKRWNAALKKEGDKAANALFELTMEYIKNSETETKR